MALVTTGGEWNRAAAEEALAGGEVELRSWLTSGRKTAVGQDDRARLWHLIDTLADGAEKTAASTALAGDDAVPGTFGVRGGSKPMEATADLPDGEKKFQIPPNEAVPIRPGTGNEKPKAVLVELRLTGGA